MGIHNVYRSWKLLRPRAFRSDLWRWMILWKYGGVYIDAKMAFDSNVDWLNFENDEFVMCPAAYLMYLNNAFIAMT